MLFALYYTIGAALYLSLEAVAERSKGLFFNKRKRKRLYILTSIWPIALLLRLFLIFSTNDR